MRVSPWLLSVGTLSTGVSAFYPVELPKPAVSTRPASDRRRFFPVTLPKILSKDEHKPLTLDLVKVPKKVRRENQFSAIMGSTPTMEDSVAINQDGNDYSYFSIANFGSKRQEMWMLLDTGASESWVMHSNCTVRACQLHNTFGIEDSDTLQVTDEKWDVEYGSGHVEGVIVKDTVSLAGFDLELAFGAVLQASTHFESYPMDGILGLGPSKNVEMKTILQSISEKKLFEKNIMGISLQRAVDKATDGQLTFGDVDKSKFTGDISYTDIIEETNRWEIPIDDLVVGGESIGFSNKSAVIDTGTSFILMPMPDAEAFHALIPGSKKNPEYFTIPCDTKLSVEFVISGTKWVVSPKDYVGYRQGDVCNSYILGRKPLGLDQWLLGDTFLKNVYSVFDYDESRIGFASRKYDSEPPSNDKSTSPVTATTSNPSSAPTVSPVPPKNVDPTQSSAVPQGTMLPEKEGAAAVLSIPCWLSLALFFSTGFSWYLSSFELL